MIDIIKDKIKEIAFKKVGDNDELYLSGIFVLLSLLMRLLWRRLARLLSFKNSSKVNLANAFKKNCLHTFNTYFNCTNCCIIYVRQV